MELFVKEWKGSYRDLEICVRNSWTSGVKLFVNKELIAKNGSLFALSRTHPFIRASFGTQDGPAIEIDVFVVALLTVRARIFVNGHFLMGDTI
jgi:hypothetical protein